MIRKITVLLAAFCCLMLAAVSPISAATSKVDYAAAAEAVSAMDPTDLLTALEQPMKVSTLPDGITQPISLDPTDPDVQEDPDTCLFNGDGTDGVIGMAGYGMTVDPKTTNTRYACASIVYAVFATDDADKDLLGDFKTTTEDSIPTAKDGESYDVATIKLDGQPAIVLTYSLEQDGTYVTVQVVAIQIGNVFVMGSVTLGDTSEIDLGDLQALTSPLTLAGVEHLADIAEAAE